MNADVISARLFLACNESRVLQGDVVARFAGPIASVLCSKFGCRLVTVTGALIGASGLILSIFCTSIHLMYVTFGLITGFGLGMTYLPAIVCVAYYFEQKRSLAIGIACCGSGVGTLVFGVFAGYLLENYGWRGGMLIEAGLVLHCCALGMIFVEPTVSAAGKKQPLPLPSGEDEDNKVKAREDAGKDDTTAVVKDTRHGGSVHSLQQGKRSRSGSSASVHRGKSEETLPMVQGGGVAQDGGETKMDKSLSRSVLNLPNYRSNPDLYSTPKERVASADDDTPAADSSGTLVRSFTS